MTAGSAESSAPNLGPTKHRIAGRSGMWRGVLAGAAVVALVGAMAGTAAAAPGDESPDTTTANVVVSEAILLSDLTPTFTLPGLPGAIVTGASAVTMNVTTNNVAGYSVTVQAATSTLTGTGANPNSIPMSALRVRETNVTPGAFTSVSSGTAVTVHSQTTRSAPAGDDISNDYQVTIPFVNDDTYSATLNYIATTL